MRRDGLTRLSGTSPGCSFLLSVVVAWLSACPAPVRGQQPSPPAPAPAPLPKNLTPNELPDPVAVPQPLASALPLLDASCEPALQSGLAEDCEFCLELWQGYCQERRHCRHVASTRRGLGFFGLCWPKLCFWGHGIPIGLPRISEPACASSSCAVCGEAHRQEASPARQESAAHVEINLPDLDERPAVAPQPPAVPQLPMDFTMAPGNSQQPSSPHPAAVRERERGHEPPLPPSVEVPVRRVVRYRSDGTARLIRLLQQAAEQ